MRCSVPAQAQCAATSCALQQPGCKASLCAAGRSRGRLRKGTFTRCNNQAPEALAAWPQCMSQQALHASSGLNSTLLHTQQQQVEQLLRQQPSPLQQQRHALSGSPLQPHGSSGVSSSSSSGTTPNDLQDHSSSDVSRGAGSLEHLAGLQQQPLVDLLLQHQQQQQQQRGCSGQPLGRPAAGEEQWQRQQHQPSRSQRGSEPPPPQQQQQQQQQQFSHPAQLTGWIKHSSSVQELQQLYEQQGASFNHIHLSAMLVALARLGANPCPPAAAAQALGGSHGSSSSSSSSRPDGHIAQQLALVLAKQLFEQLAECSSLRQAANGAWALAALRCPVPRGLLQTAVQQLLASDSRLLAASQAQEVASLAWALAKLQHDPESPVWPHLMGVAQQQCSHFKPQEMAMLLWAVASVRQRQQLARPAAGVQARQGHPGAAGVGGQAALEEAEEQQQEERRASHAAASSSTPGNSRGGATKARPQHSSTPSSSSGSSSGSSSNSKERPQPEASSGSSSTSSGSRATGGKAGNAFQQQLQQLLPELCGALSQQLATGQQGFRAQELSMLLWSLATLNYADAASLQLLADRLQQLLLQGRCSGRDVSSSLWALGKLQHAHPGLLCAAAGSADVWLARCSNQELGLLLLGSASASWQLPGPVPEVRHAVAELWQQGVGEVEARLAAAAAAGRSSVGVAELATWLQAATRALRPPSQRRSPSQQRQQLQQQRSLQRQLLSQAACAGQQPSSSGGSSPACVSWLSTSSMSGSWDEREDGAAAASLTASAWTLIAAVQGVLTSSSSSSSQPSSSSSQPGALVLEGRYVSCMLHSLAAAGTTPPPQLRAQLLAAAEVAAASMTRRQLCMTAWSVARLSGRAADEPAAALMEAVGAACLAQLPAMQPQQLSVLAWSHSRLWNLGDGLLLHELGRAALRQLPRFGPQALSNLAWAYARARHYDGLLTAGMARRARALLGQFSPGELSNLAWGLITLRCRQPGLLAALAAHAAAHCSAWSAKACVKLAVAYSGLAAPQRYRGLFQALGDALAAKPGCLAKLTPHELVLLAAAFAAARLRHKVLLGQLAAAAAARLGQVALVDQVALVAALAALQQRHEGLLAAVSERVAAELGKARLQQQVMQAAAAAPGGDAGSDAGGDSSSSGITSSSSSSKLRAQHLARLAWAYRVLRHEDAAWYAAWHTAAVQQDGTSSSSDSSSGGSGSAIGSDRTSGSSLGSRPPPQVLLHSSSGNGRVQQQLPARNGNQHQVKACTPVVGNGSSVVRMAACPVLLQRPVHHRCISSNGNSSQQ